MLPSDIQIEALKYLGTFLLGALGAYLGLGRFLSEAKLARATRRTAALQLLSDEERALRALETELLVMSTLLTSHSHATPEWLQSKVNELLERAEKDIAEVERRRVKTINRLTSLAPDQIEAVIAEAYHGKQRALGYLEDLRISKQDVLSPLGLYQPRQPGMRRPVKRRRNAA